MIALFMGSIVGLAPVSEHALAEGGGPGGFGDDSLPPDTTQPPIDPKIDDGLSMWELILITIL
jgi:hypothetical protein